MSDNQIRPADGLTQEVTTPLSPKGRASHLKEADDEQQVADSARKLLTGSAERDKESDMADLRKVIEDKVRAYVPADENQDEEAEFHGTEMVTVVEILFRFADSTDFVYFYGGAFAAFGFGGALPGFSLFFGEMVDDMGASTQGGGFDMLKKSSMYMLFFAVFVWASSAIQIGSMALFAERIAFKVKNHYFEKCLEKDADWYDRNNPAEMASKISKECSAIQRGIGEKFGNIIMSYSSFFLGFAFAFYWGWIFTLILLGCVPAMACTGFVLGVTMQGGIVGQLKAYAQSAGYAEQALNAIRIVHTYCNEALEHRNYIKFLENAKKAQFKHTIGAAFGAGFIFFVFHLLYAAAFWFGGYLRIEEIKEGDKLYTGGQVVTIMFSVIFGAFNLGGAVPHMKSLAEAKIAGKMAYDVIDYVPKVDPNQSGQVVDKAQMSGKIEFKDVTFSYPSRPEEKVLKSFSCIFEAGKTTALVGPSGSGKSTIIQLLERFYMPDNGSLFVDGQDITKLDVRSLRQAVGYVGQEPVLFNTTIKENMLFSNPNASDGQIQKALEDANAWSFIQKMEKGMDTIVGGSGGSLSGGQKQRVAIARAFVKQPRILLLDEATSALDKVNEKLVQEAIDRYRQSMGNITIIVIAHRLSTIKDADKIVVLVNGSLTEMGNHEQLLQQYPQGTYADFCEKQKSAEQRGPDQNQGETANGFQTANGVDSKPDLFNEDQENDSGLRQMLDMAKEKDKKEEEEIEKQLKPLKDVSSFKKIFRYNNPAYLIPLACVCSAMGGATQPFLGIIFGKVMNLLTIPKQIWELTKGPDYLQEELNFWVLMTCTMGVVCLFGMSGRGICFGFIGQNVTLKIRGILYERILEKDIGFFDSKENNSSVLTSTMAQDTSLINGASSESLGPYTDALFALFGGIIMGFYFSWQMSLICLGLTPFMSLGQYIGMEFQKGLTNEQKNSGSQADLLCGDSIMNYKTVQSMGYEKMIIEKYKEFQLPAVKAAMAKHFKAGFGFGLGQFTVYCVFAGCFFLGGLLIEDSYDEETNTFTTSPEDIFMTIFAILFGASQAGTAMSMGPDIGKATTAAANVFRIIEYPSKINALEQNSKSEFISADNMKGIIEFKDVWFRYPSRKDDFVLRGLNIKISPNESIALVGESGCGKSTFVNLLMRFYDVDFGEILIDGVNIKKYNLHSLRKKISLVMQEPNIFNYSILENILYGKLEASNSEVMKATQIANCTEFIEKGTFKGLDDTPMELLKTMQEKKGEITELIGADKYKEELEIMEKLVEQEHKKGVFEAIDGAVDSREQALKDVELISGFGNQCGLKGGKMSGGQKQRVAIARTLIRQPSILLLDEATSALDEANQKKVQVAIEGAMKNRTVVIIAHRMSTIERCSKIYVLEHGKVAEEGNFTDLKEAGGKFAQLSANKQN